MLLTQENKNFGISKVFDCRENATGILHMTIKRLTQAEFIRDIEAFSLLNDIALSDIGYRALNDRAFYAKIKKGLSPTLQRVERVYDFMIQVENAAPPPKPSDLTEVDVPFKAKRKLRPAAPAGSYASRLDKDETIVAFILRAYRRQLDGNFTRADLRKADPSAMRALVRWEQEHGRIPLEKLNLPTKKERFTRMIESGVDNEPDPLRRAALKKIAYARRYRELARSDEGTG